MTMAAAVELRVPFLDHRLVELATSFPDGLQDPRAPVEVHHEAVRGDPAADESSSTVPSAAFPCRSSSGCTGRLGRMAKDVLLDDRTRQRGIYNIPYVEILFQRHEAGVRGLQRQHLEPARPRNVDEDVRRPSSRGRMRLIVCTSTFPNPTEPNKGIYVYRRVRALANLASMAAVAPVPLLSRKALPSARYVRYAQIPAPPTLDGMLVRVSPRLGHPKDRAVPLRHLVYATCLLRPMARLVSSFQPDGLLSFWAYPDGFATVLLSKAFKLPVLVGAMGCDVNNLDQHLGKRRMVGWAFRNCDGAIAVSRAMGSKILELGVTPEKLSVDPERPRRHVPGPALLPRQTPHQPLGLDRQCCSVEG